jgi:hypothetical protein
VRVGSFSDKLAAALGIPPVPPPGPIQTLFNRYKKHLRNLAIETPLPETVHLLDTNFLYWIKLEYPNLTDPDKWIQAKPSVVIPMLNNGTFNETGFRINEQRANSLFNVPNLLRRPNCIHRNLRNHEYRGQGGIKGDHVYVAYHGTQTRKAAFTGLDTKTNSVILVTSFGGSREWVAGCAEMPALYVGQGCQCTCQ